MNKVVVKGFLSPLLITRGYTAAVVVISRLRQAINYRLANSPAIVALVGPRIYFGALPQTANLLNGPALTYHVVSRPYGHNLSGVDGTSQARVQISAWSYQEAEARQLIDAVRDRFDGFQGSIGLVVVTASVIENEVDLRQPPKAGTDQWLYHVASDYRVNHRA